MEFGVLHLPTSPAELPSAMWNELTVNRVLVVVAAVLAVLVLRDYVRLVPLLAGCLLRERGNVEIEHSVSQARNRNRCSMAGLFILCLLGSRYNLYPAGFMQRIPVSWHTGVLAGVMAAFLLLRKMLSVLSDPLTRKKLDSEMRGAVHHALYNYFLVMLPVILVSTALFWIFRAQDGPIRYSIWAELIVCLVFAWFRTGQILRSRYSVLQTFLYLCGLELLPVAALVACAVFL